MGTYAAQLSGGPVGFRMPRIDGLVFNRTGSDTVRGTVYQLELDQSDADVSTFGDGAKTDGFGNIVAAASGTAAGQGQMLVVAEEVFANDTQGRVTLVGITQILCDGDSDDIVAGDACEAVSGALIRVTNNEGQAVAIAGEAYADATVVLKKFFFDGYRAAFNNKVS